MKQLELYRWKEYYLIVDDRVGPYVRVPEEMAKELNPLPARPHRNQLELKLEAPNGIMEKLAKIIGEKKRE